MCAGSKQQFKAVQSRVVALQKAAKCVGCYCLSSPFFMCIQSKHLNCSAPLHNISFCEFHSGLSVYGSGKVVILAKISKILIMKNLCKQLIRYKTGQNLTKLTLCTSCGGMIAARRRQRQCSGFHGPPDD